MQNQSATRVSQGFVFNPGVRTQAAISSKGRGAATAAPSLCAPAFLTTKIEPIRPTDKDAVGRFGINFEKSYANILSCCKRFMKFVGMKFDYKPTEGLVKSQMLGELINYFESKIKPLGLELVVSKKNWQHDDVEVLQCVVYRYGRELEDTILILYCAPAVYMSAEGGQMYKRFMKFVSDSTNIPLGISEHGENFYLDCIINNDEWETLEQIEEEEDETTIKEYKEGGKFWALFDEINGLPTEKPNDLYEALEEYRKVCPTDELDLVEAMMQGIDIIKDANYFWFEFNPDDDGISNEYGYDSSEGYASSVFASAILFSEQDGISTTLLDYVNNELNAGIMMTGWNIHQWLSPKMKKADVLDFIRCKDLVASLDEWLRIFCRATEKFDLYGKSEQSIE